MCVCSVHCLWNRCEEFRWHPVITHRLNVKFIFTSLYSNYFECFCSLCLFTMNNQCSNSTDVSFNKTHSPCVWRASVPLYACYNCGQFQSLPGTRVFSLFFSRTCPLFFLLVFEFYLALGGEFYSSGINMNILIFGLRHLVFFGNRNDTIGWTYLQPNAEK